MAKKKSPRSPHLNTKFGIAVKEFGLKLLNTQTTSHMGNRGTAREKVLLNFLSEHLPNRYSVVEGEITDLYGSTSPQMDIIIYDGIEDIPFSSEGSVIMAAEATLVTIEVKSKINAQEIAKTVIAAKKLRALKPFGDSLAGNDVLTKHSTSGSTRYFHCIFAYSTDLTKTDWLTKEYKRIKNACGSDHLIDAIYVLDRGMIQMSGGRGRDEDEDGGAIGNLYFSILNFLQREGKRRSPTPYEKYTKPKNDAWVKLS